MWRLVTRLQALLNPKERCLSYRLLGLRFLPDWSMRGVTSILPFMAVVGNPDLIQTNPRLHQLYTAW